VKQEIDQIFIEYVKGFVGGGSTFIVRMVLGKEKRGQTTMDQHNPSSSSGGALLQGMS
jgi:hypothetical protein